MRVEEFEKLSKRELRAKANEAFEAAVPGGLTVAKLLEAQFYVRELEHRNDSWISIRDLILEIVVIILIGLEIIMGACQEKRQDDAFKLQLKALQNLEASTGATAQSLISVQKSSGATADSLIAVQQNLLQMNQALQKELGLFYDVSLAVLFNQPQSKMTIINHGRTNVVLWGRKFDDEPPMIEKEGRTVSTSGTGLEIPDPNLIPSLKKLVPKGTTKLVPFQIYIRNERGEEFVAHCYFGVSWVEETINITVQTASIGPEHWSDTQPTKE